MLANVVAQGTGNLPSLRVRSITQEGSSPGASPGDIFNVKDFGATGDGSTDDTVAIEMAINAAANATFAIMWDASSPESRTVVASRATVFFPSGHYLLTRTLVLNATRKSLSHYTMSPNLRGEGRAILHQEHNASDIIFGSQIIRWQVSGLTFLGGLNQLHIGNNNTDKGQIIISDCSFLFASGAAIRLLEPSADNWPATVGKQVHGKRHHELKVFSGSFSTQVTVTTSIFQECNQALVNWADWTSVSDCWVTVSAAAATSTTSTAARVCSECAVSLSAPSCTCFL
jgi:hypothetical protein